LDNSFSLPRLPHSPGVYLMRDNTGAIIYIGKALDLKKRVSSYFLNKQPKPGAFEAKTSALVATVRHVDYVPTASEREALVLERKLISQHQPVFNVMWKDDKSYPYVALTMGEDFPRLFLTRKKKRDGTLYFGPYPSVSRVRHLLHWAWRKKLFPLRPCNFDFSETNPIAYEKVRSCLYLHTGECPAPCVGKISSKKYKRIAERARLFFSGAHQKLEAQWEKEMAKASKQLRYEDALEIRDRIGTLQHMREPVTFREMSKDFLETRIQGSRAVQDLMRALNLPKPPERIECFDISHFQGTEMVASMVSFKNGRLFKAEYRKFIIRTVEGIDDFRAMAEVVGRRYKRLKAEGTSFPDLVLIDGGKGQLSSALKAIKDADIKGLSVAALAKEEEEIFLPNQSQSVRLPMDSAALLLLRQIRDEAHRFAITFHRLRRDKQTFMEVKQ